MKTFTVANSAMPASCPLPFLLGEIDQYKSASGAWELKVSTNFIEGSETAPFIADDSANEEVLKVRTTAAQAGNKVVGLAPVAVIEKEFDDYQFFSDDVTPLSGNVAYRGTLKVSQTPVFTPSFLSTENVQFAL
jgi:hypothetical protein